MKSRYLALFCVVVLSTASHAATFHFTGNLRSEAGSYNNLGLGVGNSRTKNYIAGRALLHPNLVIDDHFSIKSQWSLLTSPNFTADPTRGLSVGQGSYIFGDRASSAFVLSRAWLEWISDIGVFRLGRMPVSWGYGLFYDAGDEIWDDFQSTWDRLEYRLHLGYVVGGLAYTKGGKGSVFANEDDQEFYAVFVRYDNPEVEVEAGILFEKQQRSGTQAANLAGRDWPNPYYHPKANYAAANRIAHPLSNTFLDLFLKKRAGVFSYGGEVAWMQGDATAGVGNTMGLNALAVSLNAGVEYRKVRGGLEFLYASGDSDTNGGNATGFTLLHRNRRPGLILGRELLGAQGSDSVGLGTPLAYSSSGAFSGLFYIRPSVQIDWSPSLSTMVEMILARKAAVASGEEANLGIEFDIGAQYAVYKNLKLGADLGLLAAGAGVAAPGGAVAFALRSTLALSF